jgi:hypothetical protein
MSFTVTPIAGFAALSGGICTVSREVPYLQDFDLLTRGEIGSSALVKALDYLTFIGQQLKALFSRALTFPVNDPAAAIGGLPLAADRANMYLAFDSDGKPVAAEAVSGASTPMTAFGVAWVALVSKALARVYLDVVSKTDTETIAGDKTFSGNTTLTGNSDFTAGQISVPTVTPGTTSALAASSGFVGAAVGKVYIQTFTGSGTYTPHAGMKKCIIECVGGGGGGGGTADAAATIGAGGGGGGAGGRSVLLATAATIGVSKAVTIGAAGTGGAAGNNGGVAGGDTSVGTLCIAKGGSPGGGSAGTGGVATRGVGGVAGTGDITATGQSGDMGAAYTNGLGAGARGGSGPYGSGGSAVTSDTHADGAAATGKGCGGGGGQSYNGGGAAAGGAGTAGYVVITEFCDQ